MLPPAALVRVVPFAVFALATLVQNQFGDVPQYWIYALKTGIGAYLLWFLRPHIKEMKLKISWEGAAIGLTIFAVWIGLDGFYPMMKRNGDFNPIRTFGQGSTLSLFFIVFRILGASLVVPFLEEVFYRSFIYRFIIRSQFWEVSLNRFEWKAFILSGIIFGAGHYEWLPGILCAFAYQGLVCRKNRLGDAICAHAITNFLLGICVVYKNAYYFW
jgi:uncharacterized protein